MDYADDKVLLFNDFPSAQATLDRLTESIKPFGMQFEPSKCEVLLQDCDQTENLVISNTNLDTVDRFVYLGSCASDDGRISKEVEKRIAKARATFSSLRHLWRQKGISLALKVRVYKVTVRAVLLYGCETWPVRVEDLRRIEIFDHRCLRTLASIRWSSEVSNMNVRKQCFGETMRSSIAYVIASTQFRWLGHVLRMDRSRLPHKALHALPGVEWCRQPGGQVLTWQKVVKSKARQLGGVNRARLPGWGPRDTPLLWLYTLQDMAANRNQWRVCCSLVAESAVRH